MQDFLRVPWKCPWIHPGTGIAAPGSPLETQSPTLCQEDGDLRDKHREGRSRRIKQVLPSRISGQCKRSLRTSHHLISSHRQTSMDAAGRSHRHPPT